MKFPFEGYPILGPVQIGQSAHGTRAAFFSLSGREW
jgi:hypothetical protein